MKKLTLTSLLVGAALFTTLGTTTLSAGMKCGAGKCGDSTSKPVAKCGAKMKASAKCGAEKKAMKKAGKCGKGKCGGK
jgi:uncharacterized low-complexity protein